MQIPNRQAYRELKAAAKRGEALTEHEARFVAEYRREWRKEFLAGVACALILGLAVPAIVILATNG